MRIFGGVTKLLLVVAAFAWVAEALNERVIDLPLGRLGKYDEDQVLMADVFFRDERIPRFGAIESFYGMALIISLCCKRGVPVSIVTMTLLGFILFLVYLVTLSAVDQDAIARYGLLNFRPILTNRGAIGGPYFAVHFFLLIGIAAGSGGLISGYLIDVTQGDRSVGGYQTPYRVHSRSYRLIDLSDHCGRGCSRCIDGCGPINDDEFADNTELIGKIQGTDGGGDGGERLVVTSKQAYSEDDSGIAMSIMATSPGDKIYFGALGDFIGATVMLGLATGPCCDLWSRPEFYGLGLIFLAFAYMLILICYPMYRYGATIDDPTCEVKVKTRCMNKCQVFVPAFIAIALYYIAMSAYFGVMGQYRQFGILKFATNAAEARYFAYQNELAEMLISLSSAGVIMILCLLAYCYTLTQRPDTATAISTHDQ
jgi:hypothetical protein